MRHEERDQVCTELQPAPLGIGKPEPGYVGRHEVGSELYPAELEIHHFA